MKNFIIAALATISVFGTTAFAAESITTSDSEVYSNTLLSKATDAQAETLKVCSGAIKQTESYDDSVVYQLNGLEFIALGTEALNGEYKDSSGKFITGPEKFTIAQQNFDKAIESLNTAQDLCLESHHLQLSREGFDSALTENIVMSIGGGLRNSNEDRLSQMFRGDLLRTINRILGALAIMYIVLIGVKYVLAMGDDEKMSSYKTQFAWLILGLAVISLAEFTGFELLNPSGGNDILSGETEAKFMDKIRDIVRYFEFAAGALMLVNAILAGYHLIMSGDKDETISQEKSFLKSLLLGSGFILMSEVIVRVLSFQDAPDKTTQILISEVAGIVNFTLSFVAILAMAMLVLASLYYVISFGDEDQTSRAKRMIKTSIIGVIIASSSYVLVRFLIS